MDLGCFAALASGQRFAPTRWLAMTAQMSLFWRSKMPLPGNYTLNTISLTAYTPSCGTTPAAAYIRVPFRCRLLKATGILGGAITTADGTVTVSANATTLATFTVAQSGSAAGQLFSAVPPSPSYLNEDDVIVLTPSGASGASIPMHFSAVVRAA
jgi:hypothetical protein